MSTAIEWTDETWNPVTGCSKVSAGCKNCYAERLWPRIAGSEAKRSGRRPRLFTTIVCHSDRLGAPLCWRKPRRIFVNSMSDLFHEDVPDDFLLECFRTMKVASQHTFQILTKRPQRMRDFVRRLGQEDGLLFLDHLLGGMRAHLDHIWLGVSVEDQATADERIPLLLEAPAAVRFVSYEPALGPVDFSQWLCPPYRAYGASDDPATIGALNAIAKAVARQHGWAGIDWVIAGGESGPNARPSHPEWFACVRDDSQAAGVPFFFKQWGEWCPEGHKDNWDAAHCFVRLDGSTHGLDDWEPYSASDIAMSRVGKKAAGRKLDGRTWDDFPTCKHPAA